MQKKGQAAMEFLMTYGWAILAAIIAIGVLAYFGVFSPGKYTPDATVVNPPFYASGATINSSNIYVEIKNNGGEDVTVTGFDVDGCGADTEHVPVALAAAGSTILKMDCTGGLTGSTFSGDVTLTYTKGTSQLELTSTGTVAGKITG